MFHNGDDRPAPTMDELMQGIEAMRRLGCEMDRVRWEQIAEVSKHRQLSLGELKELAEIMGRNQVKATQRSTSPCVCRDASGGT